MAEPEHVVTLKLLADTVGHVEYGLPTVYAHLRGYGFEFVGRRWRSPDEVAALPTCRHCRERYDPDEDDTTSLWCFERSAEDPLDGGFPPPHQPAEINVI